MKFSIRNLFSKNALPDRVEPVIGSAENTKASSGAITVNMLGQDSTQAITINDSLKIEVFYSCIRDKAETIGQLPVRLYQRNTEDGTRTEIKTGRSHRIFTRKPCDYLTMQGFLEMMVASLETRGAFYAYKERNDRGNVKAIIPFKNQSSVVPNMDHYGRVYYTYVTNDGKTRDPYRAEDLFVVHGFSMDGITPISPVRYMSTLLGIAKSQEETQKESQEKGITAQMALATEGKFDDPDAIQRLKDDWARFRGPSGRSEIPILEQGLKAVSLKLTPAEIELLKNREFTVDRVSSITRVPLYRINRGATLSKDVILQYDDSYMRNSLNPILVKFEQAMNEMIGDKSDLFVQFNRNEFYAGSPWLLAENIGNAISKGVIMVNEGRVAMGYEQVEGGDVFAINTNNSTYGRWDELPSVRDQVHGKPTDSSQTNVTGVEDEN